MMVKGPALLVPFASRVRIVEHVVVSAFGKGRAVVRTPVKALDATVVTTVVVVHFVNQLAPAVEYLDGVC